MIIPKAQEIERSNDKIGNQTSHSIRIFVEIPFYDSLIVSYLDSYLFAIAVFLVVGCRHRCHRL